MKIFPDTSSLIKLYQMEIGTNLLDKILEDFVVREIFLSEKAQVEFSSATWEIEITPLLKPTLK